MTTFEKNVEELISLIESIPSVLVVDSSIRVISEGKEDSVGEFSIGFVVNDYILGTAALEFVSRAIAIYQAHNPFRFGFHIKNDGKDVIFVLDWHDYSHNDLYIYDEEVEKLNKILRKILQESDLEI